MSVRDMVGQMFMISMGSTEPDYYVNKMTRERKTSGACCSSGTT
jgi:beta-N-acetylhexosaminidase